MRETGDLGREDAMGLSVDVHAHAVPRRFLDALRHEGEAFGVRLETRGGVETAVFREGRVHPLPAEFWDVEARLRDMDRRGIDRSVLSPASSFFGYGLDPAVAEQMARHYNDGMADLVREGGGRLYGMATVPLQDPERALLELDRVVEAYGVRGVELGTDIAGIRLSDPSLRPFFRRCAELGILVMLHPYFVGPKPRMEDHYLTNLVGNPLETTLAIVDVMLSGMLDDLPDLKLLFVHGGGFLPYQLGRLGHGFRVRKEPSRDTSCPPHVSFRRLYFDTVTHDPAALRFLVGMVGAGQVLLGSDLPFDMADGDPLATLAAAGVSAKERRRICSENALSHFDRGYPG